MSFTQRYLEEVIQITKNLNYHKIEDMAQHIFDIRSKSGRIFFIGVGGSAANCSHAVNDFRKITCIECYCPSDNISEMTARTNDEGWDTVFKEWLEVSNINKNDAIFVFSIGGGNVEKNISVNIVQALKLGKKVGAKILGIVGKENGYTAEVADCCLIIPNVSSSHITPHGESFQSVIWHLLVSHPKLKIKQTKWESTLTK